MGTAIRRKRDRPRATAPPTLTVGKGSGLCRAVRVLRQIDVARRYEGSRPLERPWNGYTRHPYPLVGSLRNPVSFVSDISLILLS